MASPKINVLLTSFPGLGLPSTLCVPVSATSQVSDLTNILSERIPNLDNRLILSTNSNKQLSFHSTQQLSTLSQNNDILPLRLSAPICGGKGGFGSQLRAAGGRMASRKKRNQGEQNGSSRNLDGRRLRTVTEAKALAEYLAVKPDMDKKEKEERRKRWEEVVKMTEAKMDEIKSGGKNTRIDGQWVEQRDEQLEKARGAAIAAVKRGEIKNILRESDESASGSAASEGSESDEAVKDKGKAPAKSAPKIYGWDEDDEFMSSDEEDEMEDEEEVVEGKGKAPA